MTSEREEFYANATNNGNHTPDEGRFPHTPGPHIDWSDVRLNVPLLIALMDALKRSTPTPEAPHADP